MFTSDTKRMKGCNALWVPGTDHASIATETKVVKMLQEQGINKEDIGREEFLKHCWNWTDKYGGIIISQLRNLALVVTGSVNASQWMIGTTKK